MKKTPLNHIHRESGARLVEFAGWEMPVQYEGALREHLAVRSQAGVFDVSHMGEIEISGPDALALVQRTTCNDAARLVDGQAQYSAFLYPDGTFVDDVVIYRISGEHFLICVNAANRDKDFAWVLQHRTGETVVQDTSDRYVQLAVQGPYASEIVQSLTDVDLSQIRSYHFVYGRVHGVWTLISRTGYTGEDGFELYFSPDHAQDIWNQLFRVGAPFGIKPAGLAARNTLRLEMKYALYGNDIDQTTTPLEAGLGWVVKLGKGEFVGREALLQQKEQGLRRRLVGFEMIDRGIARDGFPVFAGGRRLGSVTSGSFGPSVGKAIGMTYLPSERAQIGQEFDVEVRGKMVRAQVTETPFYRKIQNP